jgi:hypothetical protein
MSITTPSGRTSLPPGHHDFIAIPVDPAHGIEGLRAAWRTARGMAPGKLGLMKLIRGPVWICVWEWK